MMNRYGLGIAGLIVGGLIVWGLNGFKSPFGTKTVTPKEGAVCSTIPGAAPNGTIKNGVCVAS